jgi:hypothetical protein
MGAVPPACVLRNATAETTLGEAEAFYQGRVRSPGSHVMGKPRGSHVGSLAAIVFHFLFFTLPSRQLPNSGQTRAHDFSCGKCTYVRPRNGLSFIPPFPPHDAPSFIRSYENPTLFVHTSRITRNP